jgi:hypothetical protein
MAFSVSGISATTGVSGAAITISGTGFGTTQGASNVTVGGLVQAIQSWSDTSIVFLVSADDTQGDCIVNINAQLWVSPFNGPGAA